MLINVRVQPRSKKNEIIKQDSKNYRVKLTAPPVDDRANQALISILAEYFKVTKKTIRIVKGIHSRSKLVEIIRR